MDTNETPFELYSSISRRIADSHRGKRACGICGDAYRHFVSRDLDHLDEVEREWEVEERGAGHYECQARHGKTLRAASSISTLISELSLNRLADDHLPFAGDPEPHVHRGEEILAAIMVHVEQLAAEEGLQRFFDELTIDLGQAKIVEEVTQRSAGVVLAVEAVES